MKTLLLIALFVSSFFFSALSQGFAQSVGKSEESNAEKSEPKSASKSVPVNVFSFSQKEISTNLENPVFAIFPQELSKRFIYADNKGRINWYDINSKTSTELISIESASDLSLVTFALDPKYNTNTKIYVGFYQKKSETKDLVVQVYSNLDDDGYVMDQEILRLLDRSDTDREFSIAFDFKDRLLIALHDGSKKFKSNNNSLDLESLWGKVLRYEIGKQEGEDKYIAPFENPFVLQKIKNKEIYALGFREPSNVILDSVSKKIYITDIGENTFQEFNLLEAGKNYGWPVFEGSSCLKMQLECKNLKSVVPTYLYSFKTGKSIRATNVYNSKKYEKLNGYSLVHDSANHFVTAIKTGSEPSKKKVEVSSSSKKPYQQIFFNSKGSIFALSKNSLLELVLN